MSLSIAALPPDFSWLHPAYRPSDREIDAYAHIIAHAEGCPCESAAPRLRDEAELQLWIWRAETRRRPAGRHATTVCRPRQPRQTARPA